MSWNYHFHPFTADDYNVSFATPRNVGPPLDDKPSNPKDIGATCVAWSAIDRAERRLELLIFWRGATYRARIELANVPPGLGAISAEDALALASYPLEPVPRHQLPPSLLW